MKKLVLLVFTTIVSLNIYAQDVVNDTVCFVDTIPQKECKLSDYPHAYDFVYGDIKEVDIWSGIGYVKLSDETELVIMDPENLDGIDDLKVSNGNFAVFIINYRNEVLRVDVVNWE